MCKTVYHKAKIEKCMVYMTYYATNTFVQVWWLVKCVNVDINIFIFTPIRRWSGEEHKPIKENIIIILGLVTHLPLGHVSCGAQLIFHSIIASLVRWTPLAELTMVWPLYVSHIFVPSQETVWAAKQKNSLLHVFCFIKACLSVFCGITLPISQVFLSCQLFGIENFSSQLKVGHWSVITPGSHIVLGINIHL